MRIRVLIAVVFMAALRLQAADPLPAPFPPINAYSAGLGFANAAVWDDPSAVIWNPAGLGLITSMSAEASVAGRDAEWPSSWSFILSNPSGAGQSRFGFALLRRHSLDQTGEYRSFAAIMPLSYGYNRGRIPFGLTMKFAGERYDDRDDWSMGLLFDAGVAWRISDGFSLGLSRLNIAGSALTSFRRESWLAGSLGSPDSPVVLAGQVRFDRPGDREFMERNWSSGVRIDFGGATPALRGGYLKRNGVFWYAGGVGWENLESNTRIEYGILYRAEGQVERAHFLTYGYSMRPGSGMRRHLLSFRNPLE